MQWMTRCRLSRVFFVVSVCVFIYLTVRASLISNHTLTETTALVPIKGHPHQGRSGVQNEFHAVSPKATPRQVHYLTVQVAGRLGNVMFLYASMIGIALMNGLTPAFPENHYLRYIFQLSAMPYDWRKVKSWKKFIEARACAYEKRTESLPLNYDMVELNGYYQSFKYFDRFRDEIRDEFTFNDGITNNAKEFLKDSLKQTFGVTRIPKDVLFIGIHVRLGDMTNKASFSRGYTVANSTYISKAIDYFQSKYDPRKLLFVVCSDDIEWCEHNINPKSSHVIYSKELIDAEDMALLSLCNHTILTVGSFGWWSAFLAHPGGTTIYYKDFPRQNSSLWFEFNSGDYFYPNWIGMSN